MGNLKELVSNLTYSLEESSPKIKIVVGVVGLITAGIVACKKSMDIKEKLEPEKKAFKDIHKIVSAKKRTEKGIPDEVEGKSLVPEEERVSKDIQFVYTDKDYAKDVLRTSLSIGKKLIKTYAIPVTIAVLSSGLIFSGMNTFNARNIALTTAYSTLSKAFESYKERVKERYGEEVEKELSYGYKTEVIKEKVTDENGNEKWETTEKKVIVGDPSKCSPYAFIFDKRFEEFITDPDYCQTFLNLVQKELNTKFKLIRRKYITLTELYDKLGAPEEFYTADAMRIGWLRDSDGDNYINLRFERIFIDEVQDDGTVKKVPRYLIDPNVEGDVYAKMPKSLGYAS